ncbi:MAG: helix-turn-helix domain-containing protein [Chloroflexaceae bacterium]|nr:helix-turn-helix domain-containing protein [Chloroflexaceae bacterium]
MEPLLLKVSEAAQLLNISRAKMYDLIGKGEIVSIKCGRVRRIPRTAIEQYIERQLHEQAA